MKEMRNIKRMINRANILKEHDKQNSLEYFVVDDFIYNLSNEAIEDIRKNEKKGIAYFKDLRTSTLIELAGV